MYTNSAERCRQEGWGVGTMLVLAGDVVKITAVGRRLVLGVEVSPDGVTESEETTLSLMDKAWSRTFPVTWKLPSPE